MGLLALMKTKKDQFMKNRVMNNREGLLGVMAENIKGARQCPFMMGQKCIGMFCEHFMEFYSINKDGVKEPFHRCAHVQTSLLLIELKQEIKKLQNKG